MAFLRNANRERFTVIDNTAIRDNGISLKALGLLVRMLSLPDNWEFSENGLEAIFKKDGQSSIRSGLKELEENGYLTRVKRRDEKGRITRVEWIITENPQVENPSMDNPSLESPSLGNQPQQNTNINKNEINKSRNEENTNYDYAGFVHAYNSICTSLPDCKKLTEKRKDAIRKFCKEFTPADWTEICTKANRSEFLTGNNDRHWTASIDFLLRVDKAAQILEGGYQMRRDSGNPFKDILREEIENEQEGNFCNPFDLKNCLP